MDRKLLSFTISPDGDVDVKFKEEVITGSMKPSAEDDSEEDDQVSANKYSVQSTNKPHRDLVDCLSGLKKHALAVCEITSAGQERATWAVSGIRVAGDVELKKSRVQMRLSKTVKRTKKTMSFWTPQVTMFPEKEAPSEYEAVEKMTTEVEALIDEIMAYLFEGKFEMSGQLPLFADREVAA